MGGPSSDPGPNSRHESTLAVPTGFEPAISSLTGTYARPLHHGTMRCESVCAPLAPHHSDRDEKRGGECASFHSPPLPVWPLSVARSPPVPPAEDASSLQRSIGWSLRAPRA